MKNFGNRAVLQQRTESRWLRQHLWALNDVKQDNWQTIGLQLDEGQPSCATEITLDVEAHSPRAAVLAGRAFVHPFIKPPAH